MFSELFRYGRVPAWNKRLRVGRRSLSGDRETCEMLEENNNNKLRTLCALPHASLLEVDQVIQLLPKESEFRYSRPASLLLPPKKSNDSRPTLVLDMDEALIHSRFTSQYFSKSSLRHRIRMDNEPEEALAPIQISDGHGGEVDLFVRPGLYSFLNRVRQLFELVLWTSAEEKYAQSVLTHIDPNMRYFPNSRRLFRQHCRQFEMHRKSFWNGSVKDLSQLGRNLERVCILENAAYAYDFSQGVTLPIQHFTLPCT